MVVGLHCTGPSKDATKARCLFHNPVKHADNHPDIRRDVDTADHGYIRRDTVHGERRPARAVAHRAVHDHRERYRHHVVLLDHYHYLLSLTICDVLFANEPQQWSVQSSIIFLLCSLRRVRREEIHGQYLGNAVLDSVEHVHARTLVAERD